MKKLYLVVMSLFLFGMMDAQIYSTDFDSYNVGDYLGVVGAPQWTTWSGNVGGAEDVQITNAQASSGSNSIYFSSTSSAGGPQDVVLEFGQQYTSGIFTFEADFMVEAGKGGYWNFQATQTIGQTWALNCYFTNGNIDLDGFIGAPYTEGQWFTMTIEANLTLQLWKLYVDGNFIGTWNNPINQVASLDLYPLQGDGFYADNVSFDHQTYTLQNLNAGASGVDMVGNVAGMTVNPRMKIVNAGLTAITSFDLSIEYNGTTHNENITGVNIPSLGDYEVDFSNSFNLIAGANTATAVVSNVNGMGNDDDVNDDTLLLNVNPVVPAPGKAVVGEEATGTWCQWCPRGDVYMQLWDERYGDHFIGIAVHNNDPMADLAYDSGMGALISGYPSAVVDRVGDVDPSGMNPDIIDRLTTPPNATIVNGAVWDDVTRTLDVSGTYTLAANLPAGYKVACVITEDSVTGTSSGYNQVNAYAGGGNGPMGGYESLPNPVPANQMTYLHVARGIAPSFIGMNNPFPGPLTTGAVYTVNFQFTLDPTWDETKMHIVTMIIDDQNRIDNAMSTTIDEAVANGFIVGLEEDETQYLEGPDRTLNVYPNPSEGNAYASLNLTGTSTVQLSVIDMTGKAVIRHDYGVLDGAQVLPLNLDGLASGLYTVTATINGKAFHEKLMLK